jgi:hypothetical protein
VNERAPDIWILGSGIEGDQPIAVWAIGLKAIAELVCSIPKHHRAFGAFDLDLILTHGMRP